MCHAVRKWLPLIQQCSANTNPVCVATDSDLTLHFACSKGDAPSYMAAQMLLAVSTQELQSFVSLHSKVLTRVERASVS
jgi:hypothetical protein